MTNIIVFLAYRSNIKIKGGCRMELSEKTKEMRNAYSRQYYKKHRNLKDMVNRVKQWCNKLYQLLDVNYIDVEGRFD